MYIWMILATFMVLLYSYNLSVRGDMREVKIEPQAEVVVSQLVVQQRAGQEYIRWLASPLNKTGMSYLEEKLDSHSLQVLTHFTEEILMVQFHHLHL